MKPDTNVEQRLEQLADAIGPRDSFVDDVMTRIKNSPVQPGKKQTQNHAFRRILMKNTIKLTAAAAVMIGISLLFLFNTAGSTIALAAVYAKVQQAQAYRYTMNMTMTGKGEVMGQPDVEGPVDMEMVITVSTEYGMKMENHITLPGPSGQPESFTQIAYQRPHENVLVSIIPQHKVYQTIELNEGMAEKTRKQNSDPREIIKQMLDCEYVSLGQSEINGVKVQGFETTDPAYADGITNQVKAALWVDAETWLPYYLEMTMEMGDIMQIQATAVDFLWDISVSAEDFAMVIPDDYKALEGLSLAGSGLENATVADNLQAQADRIKSATQIKQLLLAGLKYARENGQWPATLEDFGIEAMVKSQWPRDGYGYIPPQQQWPNAQSVVIYENCEQWGEGINVGFGDGHVEFIREEAEFLKRLAQ